MQLAVSMELTTKILRPLIINYTLKEKNIMTWKAYQSLFGVLFRISIQNAKKINHT